MKKLFLFFAFLGISSLWAQEQSDPRATDLLKKVEQKYESYKSLSAEFELIIEVPGEDRSIQKGYMIQQGDQYFINLPDREIYCDGQSVWLYLKEEQEVQISDVEEDDDGIASPRDFLRVYQSDEYTYALTNEFTEKGRTVQQIEFKPKDRNSDMAKIRLTIDKNSAEILQLRTFYKDGTRVALVLGRLSANKTYAPETFRWQKKQCPDCYVEDLRL